MTREDRAEVDLMIKEAFKYAAERIREKAIKWSTEDERVWQPLSEVAFELEKVAE